MRALHLDIELKDEDETALLNFLKRAVPYYESIPGVRVRLLRDPSKPKRYIEAIEYETAEAYERDKNRVASDPKMIALLNEWRELLAGLAGVVAYEDVSASFRAA